MYIETPGTTCIITEFAERNTKLARGNFVGVALDAKISVQLAHASEVDFNLKVGNTETLDDESWDEDTIKRLSLDALY